MRNLCGSRLNRPSTPSIHHGSTAQGTVESGGNALDEVWVRSDGGAGAAEGAYNALRLLRIISSYARLSSLCSCLPLREQFPDYKSEDLALSSGLSVIFSFPGAEEI